MSVATIIAASGSGLRLGGDIPKQFQLLGGRPILAHTLDAFTQADIVQDIFVAVPAGFAEHCRKMFSGHGYSKVREIIPGGASRAASVHAALKKLSTDTTIVLIHDGVRPFVSSRLVNAVVESARINGAATAVTALTDTLKEVDDSGRITATPDRRRFWRAQTPQGFTYELIMRAYAQGEADDILGHVTDDSALAERLGIPVYMVEGDAGNIKITTQEDLALGEILLRSK